MHQRTHPIIWVIGATRSCKTPIAEFGIAPLGFRQISTASYFREHYGKPDTMSREFVFGISEFAARQLEKNPECHLTHLERLLQESPQTYVIEGERNPLEFARLYDPKQDMVIFVNRTDMEKYDTLIERGIAVIEQQMRWCVSTGIAPQDSVIKLSFGGPHIKAEKFGRGDDADSTIIEGTVKARLPESAKNEDRYPWIDFVNKITVDAVKAYYGLTVPSAYDTPAR